MGGPDRGPRLVVDGVGVRRRRRQVLRGVSLEIGPGLTGLLGLNGAGKSTLLRTLVGLCRPDAGTVRLDGLDPYEAAERAAYLSRVGYVPQGFALAPGLSLGDYLRHMAHLRQVDRGERDAAVARVLDVVDLADRADARGHELSGGMVRRAGIAQALLADPQVLVLDEPTAGLDPHQRDQLRALVDRLVAESGAAVLLATHLAHDLDAADGRVLVLDAGSVVFHGSVGELADRGERASGPGAGRGTPVERGFLDLVVAR